MKRLVNGGLVLFALAVTLFAALPVVQFSPAFADPNNCSLPSGICQAATFNGQNITILDGGTVRGALSVGGNLTVTGQIINSGGSSVQTLPITLKLPDAGSVAVESATYTNGQSLQVQATNSVVLKGHSNIDGAAVVVQNITGGPTEIEFSVDHSDAGQNFWVHGNGLVDATGDVRTTGKFVATGVVQGAPGVLNGDMVTVGQLDGGLYSAHGLAANSTAISTLTISNPTGTADYQKMLYADGGIAVEIFNDGSITTKSAMNMQMINTGSFSGTPQDGILNVGGNEDIFGGILFVDNTLTYRAGLFLSGSNILQVMDGSNPLTGGVPAPLVVADGATTNEAASLGQLRTQEVTFLSAYPNALLVNSATFAGHGFGVLGGTITAMSGYKAVASGGTGTVKLQFSDGTNVCSIALPCNTPGVFRIAATGSCTYGSGALIQGTVAGITGTCSPLPTLTNLDVQGHN